MKATRTETIFLSGENLYCSLELCHLAKNLYNASLYLIRQHFFSTGKYLGYNSLQKQMQDNENPDYIALPRKVSQQILMQVDYDFKSFFNANKKYKEKPEKFKERPRIPGYKDKKGFSLLTYTTQAISQKLLKKGIVAPSQTGIQVRTTVNPESIRQVRIVPLKTENVKVEIIYEKETRDHEVNYDSILAIDLGVNNLVSLTSNKRGFQPLVVNGRPVKSINQYYNKERSRLMSLLSSDQKETKRIRRLTEKRNRRIAYYLHNTSRFVIDICLFEGIGTIVIGKNPNWKNGCNMGDTNNQNFCGIPHSVLISQIVYKAEEYGIRVEMVTEEYTSKCSFLDSEEICKHASYVGRRIKRGLFRSNSGRLINADTNGSYNILIKAFPEAFAEGIEGLVVSPVLCTVCTA